MRTALFLTASAFVLIWGAPQGQPAATTATAIVGARLIDGTGSPPVDDSVVVVEGDTIRAAGPRARVLIPRGATVVDASSKFVMPGLVSCISTVRAMA